MARWASGDAWAYPIANVAHVLGAIMLVGAIGFLDVRILGYAHALPTDKLARAATPIALCGFAVMVISGAVLFLADVRALAQSPLFLAKLAVIALAGLNALAFRLRWRVITDEPEVLAKLLAAASLSLWVAAAVLGRLIAYF